MDKKRTGEDKRGNLSSVCKLGNAVIDVNFLIR